MKMIVSLVILLFVLISGFVFADVIIPDPMFYPLEYPVIIDVVMIFALPILFILEIIWLVKRIRRKEENKTKKSRIIIFCMIITIFFITRPFVSLFKSSSVHGMRYGYDDTVIISGFNSQFEQYINRILTRAGCAQLIQMIISINRVETEHSIYITDTNKVETLSDAQNITLTENPPLDINPEELTILKRVQFAKNMKFYCTAHKDNNGYIDYILIIPFGSSGIYNMEISGDK